jgi:hypothetical protein
MSVDVIRSHPESDWPALYATPHKRTTNPHEFLRLLTSRAYFRSGIEPTVPQLQRANRVVITDIWDTNGRRKANLIRQLETNAVKPTLPPPSNAQTNCTEQLAVLGDCLVHPVIELDFVGAPDLHRYPHLRKFCSMIDFDLLSPQRVVAFWITVRLFPTRWRDIYRYRMRTRALIGAARFNELFAWPSSAELLEIADVFREYLRPSREIVAILTTRYRTYLESAQALVGQVFVTETKNENFRIALFLAAVLRPAVGADTAIIDRLFSYVGEARLSGRRVNLQLLAIVKAMPGTLDNDDISALIAEFRLPRRKFALLTPKKSAPLDSKTE